MILAENRLLGRCMTPTDFGLLMEKAAAQMGQEHIGQNTTSEQKSSIRGQLAQAKAAMTEKPAAQQHQKDREAR